MATATYTPMRNVSLGGYRDMEARPQRSNRPLIILSVIFITAIVIVGAVVWKVTKDAYDKAEANPETKTEREEDRPIGPEDQYILRLPRNVLPVHYNITIYPNFYDGAATFDGNVSIELNITSPSNRIMLHVDFDYLNVLDVKVFDLATHNMLRLGKMFANKPRQFYVIESPEEFKNSVILWLRFQGTMNKSIVGIYKSSYKNTLTNETRYLATSKFEPTYARRAFPCFDEPNMKATYTIALVHRPEYTALSNMDQASIEKSDLDNTLQVTTFRKSVKMSTYLVCFIVCDFVSVNATSKKGVPIRVFATPDKNDLTAYALEMSKYTLDMYEELFEIDYPLPKQDLIAIPDFVSGAMEHWGLITFRESALLYSPDKSTLASKKRVAQVVAHEMAHQWFGNLVTMDWWNDLWLNEGFASYMEYVGTADKEKTWAMYDQFLNDDLLPVMNSDAVINSHPIIVEVADPAQITSVFDSISYSKGASVIRMLEGIMGKQKFFKGIAKYLKKYKWRNAVTDDLWASLAEVDTNLNVKDIMDTWTIQDGYPYINITLTASDNDKTTISAKQTRFMSNPDAVFKTTSSPLGYKWYVNLDYDLSSGNSSVVVMDKKDVTFDVALDLKSKNGNWIKFNKDKYGFYRVNYPKPLWDRLTNYLKENRPEDWTLSPSDRADLLNDAFNLADAGLTPYEVPLSLTAYMSKETHYVPWLAAVAGGLDSITALLQDDPEYTAWKAFMLKLVNPPLAALGFKDTGTFLESDLPSMGIPAMSLVPDGIALRIIGAQKRPHHVKVWTKGSSLL